MGGREPWTVRRVVAWMAEDLAARGVDSARLDAELIVAKALDCDRVRLYMDLDRPLVDAELSAIRELLRRRRAREPMAYLLGYREFYGRRFTVDRRVLVPRPETELLVERALLHLRGEGRPAEPHVVDVGTGSGAIAVTLAAEHAGLQVDAVDLSEEALQVARANAERHEVHERVRFHVGDLLAPLPAGRRYDLIVANLPYVAEADLDGLQPEVAQWEPRLALSGGPDGLDLVRRLLEQLPGRLRSGGWVLLEIGAEQGQAVHELLRAAGLRRVAVHPDLAGRPRIAEACAPG